MFNQNKIQTVGTLSEYLAPKKVNEFDKCVRNFSIGSLGIYGSLFLVLQYPSLESYIAFVGNLCAIFGLYYGAKGLVYMLKILIHQWEGANKNV